MIIKNRKMMIIKTVLIIKNRKMMVIKTMMVADRRDWTSSTDCGSCCCPNWRRKSVMVMRW